MAKFRYTALDSRGKEVQGAIEADDQTKVVALLRQKGLFPTAVEADAGRPARAAARRGGGLKMEIKLPAFFAARVKPKQLMVFTRQLATLVDAGLPLLRGLRVLHKQEKHPTLKKALTEMAESIESGSTFAEALSHHPKIFTKLYVNMVKAGEVGGVMDVVLIRLAEFMEKAQRIKTKVVGAMVYPVVVLIAAGGILTGLMVFVVPKFKEIFRDLMPGKALPPLTEFVLGISQFMQQHFLVGFGGIVGLVFALKFAKKIPGALYYQDWFKLRVPLFGTLVSKTAIARFSRTLGTLMTSGVSVLQALTIVKETIGNEVIAKSVSVIHDAVKEGEAMAQPISAVKIFPPMVVSMVEVGEETGELPAMLVKVADAYDDEVDAAVAGLTSVLEPIMIIMLAVIVGAIVIALFLPLISIIGDMTNK